MNFRSLEKLKMKKFLPFFNKKLKFGKDKVSKFSLSWNKNIYIAILTVLIIVSCVLNIYKSDLVPGCLNADEAAFGYNAYSILQTGRDEHGQFLPLRLASFNDYKMPLYSYLSIPFVSLFGLSDFSTRILNKIIGVLFIPVIYLFIKELFGNKKIALLGSSIVAFSPWLYLLSRQAHETLLSSIFVVISLIFLLKFFEKEHIKYILLTNVAILLASFSYHTGRLYLVILFYIQLKWIWDRYKDKKINFIKLRKWFLLVCITVLISLSGDFLHGPTRLNSLLFNQTSGFQLKIDEFLREDSNRLLHNKPVASIVDVTLRYASQISTDYLIKTGDKNLRFGFENISLVTPFQYLAIIIGLYFLFKRKEKHRFLLVILLFLTPMTNALTWQDPSLSRTFFLIVPLAAISSYGLYEFFKNLAHKNFRTFLLLTVVIFHILFLIFSWDVYFNHYFKRQLTSQSWQCGYKELINYIRKEHNGKRKFLITKKHGQPYIFLLFYLRYPSKKYTSEARITRPDEYGFTQVRGFDKFEFEGFSSSQFKKGLTFIGYPDDFQGNNIDENKIEKIIINNQEVFWIYKN